MIKRNLVAVLVAALGITAGAAAFANAQTGDTPDSSAPSQAERREPGERPRLHRRGGPGPMAPLGRAVHGDLIVRNGAGEFVEVTFDRGTLEVVGDGEITLVRPDGESVIVKVNDATEYRGVESKDQLRTGEGAVIVSDDGVATLVGQRPEGARRPGSRPGAARAAS